MAATTPRLVDDADLPAANAARSAIQQVCIVAGPGFGAVLLLLGPPSLAFAINAATFALSALAVASIPAGAIFAPGEPEEAPSVLRELRDGARALLEQPMAVRLVGADIMCSAIYGAETVLLLLLSRDLGLGDHGYGYLLASFGLGGVLGAVLAGRLAAQRAHPPRARRRHGRHRRLHRAAGRPVRRGRRAGPRRRLAAPAASSSR